MRTSYLANVKDGVGERLINVNSSVLNSPGFRAAGWTNDPVQRTYSPPIPTAITSDYFQTNAAIQRVQSQGDEEDEGGMVTGRTSNDTIGPGPNVRRRRRKEQIEDDDSSDLSDESDEDADGAQRAAQQIRFAKMPARHRADSSPIRGSKTKNGPDVLVISPSKRSTEGRLRTGSLGAVEAVKARARRDTTTSSDMSSENEVDPAYFQRRQINTRKTSKSNLLSDTLKHETNRIKDPLQDDSDADSVGSAMSSVLGETIDSASLLDAVDDAGFRTASPILSGAPAPQASLQPDSPKKTRLMPTLQALPPPRPISYIQPVSLLSAALNAQKETPNNPVQRFAELSGKGSPNPLWIRIYAPFSEDPETPFEMPLQRTSKDGNNVVVAEAIGLSLWRYGEEERDPPLKPQQLNVNRWTLRMVEDGEVDFDFPALVRTRPVTDFTSNNNRGARGRSREKPFDEFALVEASDAEFAANNRTTPDYAVKAEQELSVRVPSPEANQHPVSQVNRAPGSRSNPLLAGQPFTSALSNTSLTPADKPVPAGPQATPRLGVTKTLRVRYWDIDVSAQTMTLEMPMDSYIAEILDQVCKRWNFDKAGFVLRVAGTTTVAPLDRTLEALGPRSDLDLVRKRFGAGPVGMSGSPGSASPNAPLLLDIQGPTKGKKGQMLHPLAQKQDMMSSASNFKKYYVTRKQFSSFTQGSQRVLVFDGDFMHVMPAETGKTLFESNTKTSSIAFVDILRCKVSTKHAKIVRVVVRRATESKRYDFEARTPGEAQEIVDDIKREMNLARP